MTGAPAAPASSSAAPATTPVVQCWVKPNDSCWFWRSTAESGALRDPSALPVDRRAHEARIQKGLWGPRWARLCPGRLLELKGSRALVIDHQTKTSEKVPASLLLLWYEGLLVLDAVSKVEPKVPWLTDKLTGILETERAKFKHGHLSALLYVQKQLMGFACTGPQFCGASGETAGHRRQLQNKGQPAEGEVTEGWYGVQALAEYLPPWEAFLHPKCGIYQDFYMVQWAPPHNKTDYGYMEHGSETLCGATWEPDECLPDDLDTLRVAVKRRWTEQQREREQRDREQLEKEKRERDAKAREAEEDKANEEAERTAKAPRMFNPLRLELIKDLVSPEVNHVVYNLLKSTEDAEIKKGWPKSRSEYPPGFGPADPPGCCGVSCDCMEDWHLGRHALDAGRPWIDSQPRNAACEVAMLAFMNQQEHVTRRGQFSGLHYLEANTDRHKREDVAQVAFAAGLAKLARSVLRDAAQRVPLEALEADRASQGRLIHRLAMGFSNDEVHPEAGGPFMPLQYQVTTGPSWLHVDAGSGSVVLREDSPDYPPSKAAALAISLTSMVPGKFDRMDCNIDPNVSGTGDSMLFGLTSKVVAKVARTEPPSLQDIMKERLSSVFDFQATQCIAVPFGAWVEAMWGVAYTARSYSVGQLLPRQATASNGGGRVRTLPTGMPLTPGM
uniref:Uncharacterized protein n=1 Tax=Pyrodinium bahamense TaxID=73915 RepID=A0A7S0AWT3_9DINO|mmetsp:Transcript_43912/g.122128  ORF Transcript_43912/g.122128 Transcript_43912/m.122128 type:complete len:671 (+) Transcript_43912:106-2118(+)